MKKRYTISFLSLLLACVMLLAACGGESITTSNGDSSSLDLPENYIESVNDVPLFDGETAYVAIKNNVPDFDESELVSNSYEKYTALDSLGRCGVAIACVGQDIMPTEERGSIGQVKPSGWHTVKYDVVDGKYLYNRCHLIGYQLTGENANEENLITGTRYLNIEGMLPFENMIADYVKETGNHVLYRVTPIFDGNNLLSRGVQMEAFSVEDDGEGICFNVYAYNAQPGVSIDYATGESVLGDNLEVDSGSDENSSIETVFPEQTTYVLNTNSKKIHLPTCKSTDDIEPENKEISSESKEELINKGYTVCKNCNP